MGSHATLIEQHRAIEALRARMLGTLDLAAVDTASVAVLRWRICQEFLAHLKLEDALLYDPLLRSGDAAAMAAARTLRDELATFERRYRDYMAEWPLGRINAEWNDFKVATRTVLAGMVERSEREETALFAYAERVLWQDAPTLAA